MTGGRWAFGVNNVGQIVGANNDTGLLWNSPSDDTPAVLASLDGDNLSKALGINDYGIVFGTSTRILEGGGSTSVGVVWLVPSGAGGSVIDGPVKLPPLVAGSGVSDSFRDINEVVINEFGNRTAQVPGSSDGWAVIWEIEVDASTGKLYSPSVSTIVDVLEPSYSAGYGINNLGDACGILGDDPFVAFAGQAPLTLSVPRKTYQGVARSINGVGEIVGYAEVQEKGDSSPPYTRFAYLWTAGERMDLSQQIAAGSGWNRLAEAIVINEQGVIGGYGDLNGKTVGFLLSPLVP